MLSETEGRVEKREMCSAGAQDERRRDRPINCQTEAVNPGRQRKEHACVFPLQGPRGTKVSGERAAAKERQSAQERWWQ